MKWILLISAILLMPCVLGYANLTQDYIPGRFTVSPLGIELFAAGIRIYPSQITGTHISCNDIIDNTSSVCSSFSASDFNSFRSLIYTNVTNLNLTKSGIGDCPTGQFVQNLTTGAPQCYTPTAGGGGSGNVTTNTGTSGFLPFYTSSTNLNNSNVYSNGTYVGIGTNTPQVQFSLNITGSPLYRTLAAQALFQATNPSIMLEQVSTSDVFAIILNNNRARFMLKSGTGSVATTDEFMSVSDTTKYVGINTTLPNSTLHVKGETNLSGNLFLPTTVCSGNETLSTTLSGIVRCINVTGAGGGSDGNNYTTSISMNTTGSLLQLNVERNGMSNLSTTVTLPSSSGSSNTVILSSYYSLHGDATLASGSAYGTTTSTSYTEGTPSGCVTNFGVGNGSIREFDHIYAKFSAANTGVGAAFYLYKCTGNGTSCDSSTMVMNMPHVGLATSTVEWENTTGNWTVGRYADGSCGSLGCEGNYLYFMDLNATNASVSIATITPYSSFAQANLGSICKRTSNAGNQNLYAPSIGSMAPQIIVAKRWSETQ